MTWYMTLLAQLFLALALFDAWVMAKNAWRGHLGGAQAFWIAVWVTLALAILLTHGGRQWPAS